MRYLACVIAASAFFSPICSASAQSPTHFRGKACILTMTASCQVTGFRVGQCANAMFRPPNYGGSGNWTNMTLLWDYFAQGFYYSSGSLVGLTFRPVIGTGVYTNAYNFNAQIRIPAQSPANPVGAAALVSTIDINDFRPGCNIRIRLVAQSFGANVAQTEAP